MSVGVGTRLGSLEITAFLGKGGMGEVYRARDTKLKREVAVKILPDEFSRDAGRVSRFQREAEVLASLNHPNIAAIYEVQEADNMRFLVLELVEGETLAERIQRGAIPAEEALDIAKHICEALEAAHEKGIVHRDLKPANVKITAEGQVKVLDFGLAKALDAGPSSIPLSNSPTMLSGSLPGLIVGTAGYMSPEQARGRAADQRSDVFAFGSVLYEMLSGRQAFQGEDVSDVLASVIKSDPDFNALPANLNPKLCDLLRRSLDKNRKQRWYAMGDVRLEIEAIIADPHGVKLETARAVERRSWWRWVIPIGVTAAIVATITTIVVRKLQPVQSADITRFSFVLPQDQRFTNAGRHLVAISPDGASIVYVANQQLYLRKMADAEARPIPGTAQKGGGVNTPFFSPDGRWVGFYAIQERRLKKIAITGGAAVLLCDDVANPFGATWASDDRIYFGQGPQGIMRVSANGANPETVVTVKPGEAAHGPQVLPGGDALLFTLANAIGTTGAFGNTYQWDNAQIVVQLLKSGERHVLIPGGSDARYVPTGHIVYAFGSTLFAAPFDFKKLQVTGDPVPVIQEVLTSSGNGTGSALTGAAQFSISSKGSMVYVPDADSIKGRSVALVDRAGVRMPINLPPGQYNHPRISPNGKQLVLQTDDGSHADISIYDLTGASSIRRLTYAGRNSFPIWTRDGQRIVFTSDREGDNGLFWQPADGGSAERLMKAEQGKFLRAGTWSPDGKLIFSVNPGGRALWMLSPAVNEKPQLLIDPLRGSAIAPAFSPDGRWLAYESSESGPLEVYVQPFPLTEAKYQISAGGGHFPVWSSNGRQLFYATNEKGGGSQIISVDIQTQPSFTFKKPTPLPIEGILSNGVFGGFAITPDDKFVVLVREAQTEPSRATSEQINITLNWLEELNQRVPVK